MKWNGNGNGWNCIRSKGNTHHICCNRKTIRNIYAKKIFWTFAIHWDFNAQFLLGAKILAFCGVPFLVDGCVKNCVKHSCQFFQRTAAIRVSGGWLADNLCVCVKAQGLRRLCAVLCRFVPSTILRNSSTFLWFRKYWNGWCNLLLLMVILFCTLRNGNAICSLVRFVYRHRRHDLNVTLNTCCFCFFILFIAYKHTRERNHWRLVPFSLDMAIYW